MVPKPAFEHLSLSSMSFLITNFLQSKDSCHVTRSQLVIILKFSSPNNFQSTLSWVDKKNNKAQLLHLISEVYPLNSVQLVWLNFFSTVIPLLAVLYMHILTKVVEICEVSSSESLLDVIIFYMDLKNLYFTFHMSIMKWKDFSSMPSQWHTILLLKNKLFSYSLFYMEIEISLHQKSSSTWQLKITVLNSVMTFLKAVLPIDQIHWVPIFYFY